MHDLRFAVRMLGKHPGFTAAVVLSLALGIGANTAIFTLIDAVMWRLLPVKDPQALLVVARQSSDGEIGTGFTYGQYTLLRDNAGSSSVSRLRHRPDQRCRRRSARGERAGDAGVRHLLLAVGRFVRSRQDDRSGRRSGAQRTSRRDAEPRVLGAPIRTRSCRHRTDHQAVRDALHDRRRGAGRILRRRAGQRSRSLSAADDAAHGHAGVREPARQSDRQSRLGPGDRTHGARRDAGAGGRGARRRCSRQNRTGRREDRRAARRRPGSCCRKSRRCPSFASSSRDRSSSCWSWSAWCC